MSKAEDLAKELYPDWEKTGVPTFDGQEESMVRIQRVAYIKGYEQAEKDLELTVEDIVHIIETYNELGFSREFATVTFNDTCKEVLKRFKTKKEK
jgi:ABC-type Mn2+/Zn2+ transport system ATPase subunit